MIALATAIAFQLMLHIVPVGTRPPVEVPKGYDTEEACKADAVANGAKYLRDVGIVGNPKFEVMCQPVMGQ